MILTVADHKGGVGKTTTACALAQAVPVLHKRGRALLVDTDTQGSASRSVYGITDTDAGLYSVIKGTAKARDVIQETPAGDILPYSENLYALDVELAGNKKRDNILKKALQPVADDYTHIIIDTAPGITTNTIQALTAADAVLIPLVINPEALEGLRLILKTVRDVQDSVNPALKIAGVVFTQYNPRANITRQYEELITTICKDNGVKVLKSRIRRGVAVQEAHALKQSLFEYAPKTKPTLDYLSLAKELKL